ncbi:hypothetical protein [Candidatus Uabimicrobium amorphum]|uniref:Uncharacterized protein n=1 Tax=Uabimicrobium amorphum TaxID=2596890 RepID=A0A5S9F2E4_UABAM|nr:hypothetical protein [Candidatus Uabimicrobium amorphum]BBM83348.1 hypothetical protein UABAM_01700 [Candidatus Uabimicrobium amorphum]
MLKKIKFQQIRDYIAEWQSGIKKPNNSFGILTCIGYLRRERLNQEELTILREIEVMIKNSLSDFLEQYEIFMDESFLLNRAQELVAEIDEDLIEIFCQLRDEQQMSFDLIQEYTQDLDFPSQVICKVRNFLLSCDEEVCWNKSIVLAIQEAGHEDPLLDQEVYWWHNKPNSDACWVPNYIKEKWMAMACDNSLTQKQNALLQSHIQQCNNCNTQYEWLLELFQHTVVNNTNIIPDDGIELPYFQPQQDLAAASIEKQIEINILDGKIYGIATKNEGNIIYQLASREIELNKVPMILQYAESTIPCIFLPFGDENELALFPRIDEETQDTFPEIIFPYKKDTLIRNVKLYKELEC